MVDVSQLRGVPSSIMGPGWPLHILLVWICEGLCMITHKIVLALAKFYRQILYQINENLLFTINGRNS